MRFRDQFQTGFAADLGPSHLLRAIAWAVLATVLTGTAHAQVDVLWSSYHDGRYFDLRFDEEREEATLVVLGDDAAHFHTRDVDGNRLAYERIAVGADVDGILKFESEFVAWTEETIPHDPYGKHYDTRLVVTGLSGSGEENWRFQTTESDDLNLIGGFRDAEGNFVFTVEHSSYVAWNTHLYKVSPEGTETWNCRLGSYLSAFSISQDEQGNYVVLATNLAGRNEAPDAVTACPGVIRISEAGEVLSRECMLADAPGYEVLAQDRLSDGSLAILLGKSEDDPWRLVQVRPDGEVIDTAPPLPLSGSPRGSQVAMVISEDTLALSTRRLNHSTRLTWLDGSYRIIDEVVVDADDIPDYGIRRIVPVGFGTYLIAGPASDGLPPLSFMARIWIEDEEAIEHVDETIYMFPNPTHNELFVRFELPRPEKVGLLVHDVAGRSVYRRVERFIPAGSHILEWNGYDGQGMQVPSGVYLVTLIRGDERYTETVPIVR